MDATLGPNLAYHHNPVKVSRFIYSLAAHILAHVLVDFHTYSVDIVFVLRVAYVEPTWTVDAVQCNRIQRVGGIDHALSQLERSEGQKTAGIGFGRLYAAKHSAPVAISKSGNSSSNKLATRVSDQDCHRFQQQV